MNLWFTAFFGVIVKEYKTICINITPPFKIKRKEQYKNVQWLNGNSGALLPDVLKQFNEPVIFWLDAHGLLNDEITYADTEYPLIAELSSILKSQHNTKQECVILIDDARLFTDIPPKPYHPERWPDFYTIVTILDNFHIDIINDVIFCVPARLKDLLND